MTTPVSAPDPLGILPIHASAVVFGGTALVFLGPSGTGKSTIRKLLGSRMESLADDAVYLVPRESGLWTVADAGHRAFARSLTHSEAVALGGPILRAVFRLYQAPASSLRRISRLMTARYLVDAVFEVPRYRDGTIDAKKALLFRIANLARSVAGYELDFSLNGDTLEVITAVFDTVTM